jgi:hypothetical protein
MNVWLSDSFLTDKDTIQVYSKFLKKGQMDMVEKFLRF